MTWIQNARGHFVDVVIRTLPHTISHRDAIAAVPLPQSKALRKS